MVAREKKQSNSSTKVTPASSVDSNVVMYFSDGHNKIVSNKVVNHNIDEQIQDDEFALISRLGINIADLDINLYERSTLANIIQDMENSLFVEQCHIFSSDEIDITPINIKSVINQLLSDCQIMYELCLSEEPNWAIDYFNSIKPNLDQLLAYGNQDYRTNYLVVMRFLDSAIVRQDMSYLADLFLGEVPSLLKELYENFTFPYANERRKTRKKKSSSN